MSCIYRTKKLFWLSVIFLFLMWTIILLMPIAVKMPEHDRNMVIFVGLEFCISAITGYMIAFANRERRWFIKHKPE